jgi:hypothetical protein
MSSIDFKLAAARPSGVQPDAQFTEAVMLRITRKKYSNRIIALFHRSPVMATLMIIAAIALISGTAYAVSYLWPKLYPSISKPQQSTAGRVSVIVTDCDKNDVSKRYELKKDAPVSADRINDIVKAQCELNTISDWSSKTYEAPHGESQPDNKPGSIQRHTTITPAMFAVQLATIDRGVMTIIDSGSLRKYDVQLSSETKVIVDGQYAKLDSLLPDDVVAYVSKDTVTTRNQATCTDESCHADIISSSEQILAVIKLTYSFNVYRAISYLNAIPVCSGNVVDDCPETSSIDVYQSTVEAPTNYWADIAGRIVSYDDQSIILATTSGRQFVVHTPWNLIATFNATKSSSYGLSIATGDTLAVTYNQASGDTRSTDIPWRKLQSIRLLLEANSKAGPFQKY